jgi:esterase/lipase superfamily enzyme
VDAINRQLGRTRNKQVNIYVHGCCTDLEAELKQVAPFQQFLGRGGAMIVFSWPSRQAIRLYGGDVDRARESGAQLERLIEFLAKNTRAERINILAYSAGGNAMNQGLIKLRESHAGEDAAALQRELKVGNAVFAGSEIDVQQFARDDLKRFLDLTHEVTIYISDKDSALKLASTFGGGGDRLGAANTDALTREELERLASVEKLHVIDISSVPGPHETDGMKGHGYWYGNEWVMSDILTIFRWDLPPQERGLNREPGGKWTFPPDYPSRITQAVLKALGREPQ